MGKYFGTDGIRGLAGETLTATQAYRIGRFLGAYQQKRHRIILGMDTRISSTMLISSLIAGIPATGSDVINLGVITTPAISYLLAKHDCTFGVMVSASHNPYYDNGIKIFNAKGEKLKIGAIDVIKEFNYAGDIIRAIWILVNQNKIHEVVIGSGKGYLLQYWVALCFEKLGLDWNSYVVNDTAYRKPDFKSLISNPSLIKSLGWKQEVDIDQLAFKLINNFE